MDQYIYFSVEDFVWDNFFRQWVLLPDRESDALWSNWLSENPQMTGKVNQAREIVFALKVSEPDLTDEEIRQTVNQTISQTSQPNKSQGLEHKTQIRPLYRTVWFRIAASIVVLAGIGWLSKRMMVKETFQPDSSIAVKTGEAGNGFVKKVNNTEKPMRIVLRDKSSIVLTPGSYITYKDQFVTDKREVFLVGEAFFEVTKDTEHPFFVYANELVTKVLGTSFTVRALESSREITVEVKTGRVSVFAKSDRGAKEKLENNQLVGLVLSPNQKIIYKRDEVRLVRALVEKPEMILPEGQRPQFEFEDTPVTEVFQIIQKAYGVEILYDAELLKDCPLTATLDNQPLNEKLTIICKAIEANYEILDGQIVIHSKGCRN
jgi:hypothetical protein